MEYLKCYRDSSFSIDVERKYKRSSKIAALFMYIDKAVAAKEKCVVFSQFLGMLSLIEHDLKLNKILYTVNN